MCISPITMKNPYKRRGASLEHNGRRVYIIQKGRFDYLHNTVDTCIQVPCGRCSQCIAKRQSFYNQRIQMESLRSELFYFTLTYANRALARTGVPDFNVIYPYYPDIQNMFKRLRKILPHPIRTLVVSEYGSKKSRPHFHGFLAIDKEDIKQYYKGSVRYCERRLYNLVFYHWKRNISNSHKHPIYMPLSDLIIKGKKRTYDFHHVEPIINHDNDLSFYVSKYIVKYNESIEKLLFKIKMCPTISSEQRKYLTSCIKPRMVLSKDFGSYKLPEVSKYIHRCIKRNSDFPTFYDINTGKSTYMSPYYAKRFIDLGYKFKQYENYLNKIQYLEIDPSFALNSYNPELLINQTIHDANVKSYQAYKKDKKLRKIKNLLSKK